MRVMRLSLVKLVHTAVRGPGAHDELDELVPASTCAVPTVPRNLLLTKPITYHMDFITELHPLVEGHLMDARVQGE